MSFKDSNINNHKKSNDENSSEDGINNNFTIGIEEYLCFPVTVGKSFKNNGWAVKRGYLEEFFPKLDYEKNCTFFVDGIQTNGKINIHTRLFYFVNDELKIFLKNLHDIDPKIKTRVDLKLNYGKYELNSDLDKDYLLFTTKFSKSFQRGMFVIPRSISKDLVPILPYEYNAVFFINGIKVEGRFNIEFRITFHDKRLVSYLESIKNVNDQLEIKIILKK